MRVLLLILFTIFSSTAFTKVILVDPGHGGEEVGAVGFLDQKKKQRLNEKDLSLRLAKKIKDELSKETTSYLTRSVDRSVSLQERADLADLVKADLFISVHFNSNPSPKSHGFELYYLDNNSNVGASKIERAENLNLKGEELIVNQILVDLVVQQTVSHSRELASAVHQTVKPVLKKYNITDRGVKRGLFYVLALSKRPGILVETGFISNPGELKVMNQEKFLSDMARAVAGGIIAHVKSGK